MDRMFNWIKGHKIASFAILLGLFIVPIIAVQLLFKWKTDIYWIQADWESGDVLAYIGGFYAFLGTVIFSMLTLWQNNVIDRKNDEYNKKVEKMQITLNMPVFGITEQIFQGNYSNFKFTLKNISCNPAIHICISDLRICNSEGTEIMSPSEVKINNTILMGGEKANVNVKNNILEGTNLTMSFYIQFQDKFYNSHKVMAIGAIKDWKKFETIHFNLRELEDTHNANT